MFKVQTRKQARETEPITNALNKYWKRAYSECRWKKWNGLQTKWIVSSKQTSVK